MELHFPVAQKRAVLAVPVLYCLHGLELLHQLRILRGLWFGNVKVLPTVNTMYFCHFYAIKGVVYLGWSRIKKD
jgi:hypothetical protein